MVNKTKVNNLLTHIAQCDTVEVAGEAENVRISWDGEIKGDPENQILLLTWEDDEGQEFSVILTEQGLSAATVEGNTIACEDCEGDEFLLRLWDLKEHNISA